MEQVFFERAKPVWAKGGGEKNLTCLFSVRICRGTYRLKITACNFYRIFRNGVFFAYGPARAAHGYARVDEYEMCAQADENIVVEVAGYRCNSFYALNEQPFLQAELLKEGRVVLCTAPGGDFSCSFLKERLQKVARFSYQRPFSESYAFSGNPEDACCVTDTVPTEEIPARKLLPRRVGYPRYDEAEAVPDEWGEFEISEAHGRFTNRFLTKSELGIFPLEQLETFPSDNLEGVTYRLKERTDGWLRGGEYAVYAFDYPETGFLKIEATVGGDCHFLVLFDEVDFRDRPSGKEPKNICFYRNDTYNIIEYRAKAGAFKHVCFEPYTMRYAKIVVLSGKLNVGRASLYRYENPDCVNFAWEKGDAAIDRIVEAAVRTFRHNAVDLLTDCPSRERAGWLCDSWFSARAEKLFTGENKTEYNFLENIALSPELPFVPSGMVPMCYPADFSEQGMFIPNWAMWYVLELYDRSLRTKCDELLLMSKRKAYAVLNYFEKFENADGLLEDLDGWIFVEWSKANDPEFVCGVNYPSNMMYYAALRAAGKLFGDGALLKKAEKVRAAIRAQSFDGTFYEDNSVRENGALRLKGHISETCQYYAFFTGVATYEEDGELWNILVENFGAFRNAEEVFPNVYPSNAFIGDYLRMILLSGRGLKARMREEAVACFEKMAKLTGTLWEHDGITGSLNHGFASYIAVLLLK